MVQIPMDSYAPPPLHWEAAGVTVLGIPGQAYGNQSGTSSIMLQCFLRL